MKQYRLIQILWMVGLIADFGLAWGLQYKFALFMSSNKVELSILWNQKTLLLKFLLLVALRMLGGSLLALNRELYHFFSPKRQAAGVQIKWSKMALLAIPMMVPALGLGRWLYQIGLISYPVLAFTWEEYTRCFCAIAAGYLIFPYFIDKDQMQ